MWSKILQEVTRDSTIDRIPTEIFQVSCLADFYCNIDSFQEHRAGEFIPILAYIKDLKPLPI